MFSNSKSFKEKLKDTGFLLKNSFSLFPENKELKIPLKKITIYSIIASLFLWLPITFFIYNILFFPGVLMLLIFFFVLLPYGFFYKTRQKAILSNMVYETLKGNPLSYQESYEQLKEVSGSIRMLALADIIISWATSSSGEQKKGVIGIIVTLLLKALEEVWDLAKNYLIPAVSIEKKSIQDVAENLKYVKNNIPATLTGVFGIDFVGNILGSLFFLSFLIFLILGVGLGWIIAMFNDSFTVTLGSFTFSYVLLPVFLLINSILKAVYDPMVQAIKQIYFSIFYVTLAKPSEIKPEFQENLTHYLRMENSTSQSQNNYQSDQNTNLNNDGDEEKIKNYILQNRDSYSKDSLKVGLMNSGFSEEDSQKYLDKYF